MPTDHIVEAEKLIDARVKSRIAANLPAEARSALALETIADEVTLLRAEIKILRELYDQSHP